MLLLGAVAPGGHERDEIDEERYTAPPEALARDEAGLELGGVEPSSRAWTCSALQSRLPASSPSTVSIEAREWMLRLSITK